MEENRLLDLLPARFGHLIKFRYVMLDSRDAWRKVLVCLGHALAGCDNHLPAFGLIGVQTHRLQSKLTHLLLPLSARSARVKLTMVQHLEAVQ